MASLRRSPTLPVLLLAAACSRNLSVPSTGASGPPPSVQGVSPKTAFAGQTVTVTGSSLGGPKARVQFGVSAAQVLDTSTGSSLMVTVPSDVGNGALTVTTDAGSGRWCCFASLGPGHPSATTDVPTRSSGNLGAAFLGGQTVTALGSIVVSTHLSTPVAQATVFDLQSLRAIPWFNAPGAMNFFGSGSDAWMEMAVSDPTKIGFFHLQLNPNVGWSINPCASTPTDLCFDREVDLPTSSITGTPIYTGGKFVIPSGTGLLVVDSTSSAQTSLSGSSEPVLLVAPLDASHAVVATHDQLGVANLSGGPIAYTAALPAPLQDPSQLAVDAGTGKVALLPRAAAQTIPAWLGVAVCSPASCSLASANTPLPFANNAPPWLARWTSSGFLVIGFPSYDGVLQLQQQRLGAVAVAPNGAVSLHGVAQKTNLVAFDALSGSFAGSVAVALDDGSLAVLSDDLRTLEPVPSSLGIDGLAIASDNSLWGYSELAGAFQIGRDTLRVVPTPWMPSYDRLAGSGGFVVGAREDGQTIYFDFLGATQVVRTLRGRLNQPPLLLAVSRDGQSVASLTYTGVELVDSTSDRTYPWPNPNPSLALAGMAVNAGTVFVLQALDSAPFTLTAYQPSGATGLQPAANVPIPGDPRSFLWLPAKNGALVLYATSAGCRALFWSGSGPALDQPMPHPDDCYLLALSADGTEALWASPGDSSQVSTGLLSGFSWGGDAPTITVTPLLRADVPGIANLNGGAVVGQAAVSSNDGSRFYVLSRNGDSVTVFQ